MAGLLSGLSGKSRSSPSNATTLERMIPLRQGNQPDQFDGDRRDRFLREYNRQTDALLTAHRQIEYNVRMLLNQQWSYFSQSAGVHVDVSDWFTEEERRWRQLPTLNEELRWYVNTHSRITENPPILTWLPGPDAIDAELAETLDALVKFDWRRSGMASIHPQIMMWLICAGRGHCASRLDLTKGDWRPWVGTQPIPRAGWDGKPLMGPDGQPLMTDQAVPDVPIKYDGTANAVLMPNGQVMATGKGHMERTGAVAVDVYSPLQVRAEWGPSMWHDKRWHEIQRFMSPEAVYDQWGIEVEPDVNVEGSANVALLERILYGGGFFGSSRNVMGGAGYPGSDVKGPLCTVFQRWEKPLAFNPELVGTPLEPMMETPDTPSTPDKPSQNGNPGGRETVYTPTTMIYDGPRAVRWPHTSPVRCFDFVQLPGRPMGLTPLESLHSPQRTANSILELLQSSLRANGAAQRVVWEGFGILADDVDNAPNRVYTATGDPSGGVPIAFITPPPVNPDNYKVLGVVLDAINRLGGTNGTTGAPPSPDPSGVAVQELRFNADRDLGDTARRNVEEYGRLAEDWKALYRIMYTMEQVISISGNERAAQTILVYPDLFAEGSARCIPDAESMLPEGRGERQTRAHTLWQEGAFGDPRDPNAWAQATETFLEMAQFPNYSKMARPGGPDRITAEEENAQFLLGAMGQPVLPWYDDGVHIQVHTKLMKSREWLKLPPEKQQAMAFHLNQHQMSQQAKMLAQAEAERKMQMASGTHPSQMPQHGPQGAHGAHGGPPHQQHGGHKPGGSRRHVGGHGKGPATTSEPATQPAARPPKSQGGSAGRSPLAPST